MNARPENERPEHDENTWAGDAPRSAESGSQNAREDYKELWLRAQADYQNLRRRLQSDIDAAVGRGKGALISEVLLVLDYLDMALATPCTTPEGKNLLMGVEMTRGVLLRTLEKEKVSAVAESGAFDAAVHQAVERVETDQAAPNTLLATLRKGYAWPGGVLRPAQVRVAASKTSDSADASEGA